MRFGICLAVRSLPGVPKSKFTFLPIPELDRHGVDVARDDILQNYVTREDQMMNGDTPWRGAREKSTLFLQMLIQATTMPGDLVLDCTAGTGASSVFLPCFFLDIAICFCETEYSKCDLTFSPLLFLGSSIHACRNVNRHIAALEPDTEIFQALLAPLVRSTPVVPEITKDHVTNLDDIDGQEIEVERVVKKSRFSK